MHSIAKWILGPVWQATLLATFFYLLPVVSMFAVIIQLFVTLRQGAQKGLIIVLGSITLSGVLGFLLNSLTSADATSVEILTDTMQWSLIVSLSLWVFAAILNNTVSLMWTSQLMAISFMLLFALTYGMDFELMPQTVQAPIKESVDLVLKNLVDNNKEITEVVLTDQKIVELKNFLVKLFSVVSMYTMFIVALYITRLLQSILFMPGGFKQEFTNLRAGQWFTIGLIGSWISAIVLPDEYILWSYILSGVIFIGGIWLLVNGVALFHWFVARNNLPWPLVLGFYILFLIPMLSSMLIMVLVLLALADGFINIRMKLEQK